jgi:glycosyltransferase involved in cell wall biosynthesis
MHCEWLNQLDRAMIDKRLEKVDAIVGCSEYITNKIRTCFPQHAGRCRTVYNGVDTDRFFNNNGKRWAREFHGRRLLFVGRVSPEKGVHVLLEAFRNVVERYPDTELVIVGPQGIPPLGSIVGLSDERRIKDLARFYTISYHSYLKDSLCSGLSSQVFFTGSVPHLELPEYYCNADILINPSLYEAFGMTLVESMACRLPVIATRVGGMVEVVEDGKNGLLVEPDSVSDLTRAILDLLSNEDLRKTMGIAARKRAVEHFSYERTAGSLRQCYSHLC